MRFPLRIDRAPHNRQLRIVDADHVVICDVLTGEDDARQLCEAMIDHGREDWLYGRAPGRKMPLREKVDLLLLLSMFCVIGGLVVIGVFTWISWF